MSMSKPIRAAAQLLTLLGLVGGACSPAAAQKTQATDKQVYAAIDCKQWTHNDNGTWSGGPGARVGAMAFPNTINNAMKGYVDSGVDAEMALLKKCGKH
jgi:hypothetical protein